MMTLFPLPDQMTSPGGCKSSIERFARNDLVWRFFDFKRSIQENQHSSEAEANLLERNTNLDLSVQKFVDGGKNLRHLQTVAKRRRSTRLSSDLERQIGSRPTGQVEFNRRCFLTPMTVMRACETSDVGVEKSPACSAAGGQVSNISEPTHRR